MNIKQLFLLPIICALLLPACKTSQNELLEKQSLEQIRSTDWKVREKGLITLIDIKNKDFKPGREVQEETLNLLKNETHTFNNYKDELVSEGKTPNQITEEFHKKYPPGGYDDYAKILAINVASSKIEGSLPSLFKFITDTNYTITPALLTMYGPENLNFFIEKATNGTEKERELALNVLSIWVEPSGEIDDFDASKIPHLNPSEIQTIKPIFIRAANDSSYNIRFVALFGLNKFISEPEIKNYIFNMAKNDNEEFIREKASEILQSRP